MLGAGQMVKNGKRYVLVGREDGLAFVDVTRPEAPNLHR